MYNNHDIPFSAAVHTCSLPLTPSPGPLPATAPPHRIGNNAFVFKAPLHNSVAAAAAAVRKPAAAAATAATSPLFATAPAAVAEAGSSVAPRTPWTCLAPGGKVGRAKVSLDRAVTSVAAPKSETVQETKVTIVLYIYNYTVHHHNISYDTSYATI